MSTPQPAGHEIEELPPPHDEFWDHTTSDTLAFLRELRSEHRRRRLGSVAYVVYVGVLFGGIYGAPYVIAALKATVPDAATAPATGAVVAAAVCAVLLALLIALLRDGAWRGPALVDPATTAWVVSSPVRIGALVRPRLRVSLLVMGLVGVVAGAFGGLEVHVLAGGSAAALAGAGAFGAGVVAVLGTALAAFVEVGAAGWARRLGSARAAGIWAAVALVAGVVVWAEAVRRSGGSGAVDLTVQVLLWSGPWGWAAQPLVAATPAGAGLVPAWPLAAVAAAGVGAVVAVLADRHVGEVPVRELRRRAQTVSDVSGAVFTLQPRRARLVVQAAQGWTPRRGGRIRVPRTARMLVPWRDATALLRMPSRALWGLVWLVVALWLVSARDEVLLRYGALLAAYLSAAQLVEPARVDADDVGRMRILPVAASRQAIEHAIVPAVAMLVVSGGWIAVAAVVSGGGDGPNSLTGWPPAWRVAIAVPALVGAALVSAFRGWAPMGAFGGGSSPVGDAGPAIVMLWYLRGPLVALLLLTPLALDLGEPIAWAVLAAILMLQWTGSRAAAVLRG
jgi:hypothetical protein